jgi:hypothetical protein
MEPTGVLVLRVWREPDLPGTLRVRITTRLDVASSAESSETFDVKDVKGADGGADELCDSVRSFLLTFSECS